MSSQGWTVRLTDWADARDALRAVRTAVFIDEQHIPADMEWDAADALCDHALALAADGAPIGCGRLLQDGRIGRVAVLRAWRGQGVGAALLSVLVELVRGRGHAQAVLSAQTHALNFYVRQGFVAEGAIYLDAGLPHQTMRLVL